MTGFTDVFGGSTVQPSNVAYASVALSTSILTYWPPYVTGTQQPLARLMDVIAASSGLTINLPDATLVGLGQDVFFNNPGSNTFTVKDSGGGVVATIAAGQQKYLYLSDNSTSGGTWRVTLFGVGASAPDAASLVGYGLKAIGTTLNQSATTSTISASTTFSAPDRSKVFVNTGGAITCTLPLTSTVSNDFFLELRNQGTGTATVAPIGGETVDGSASIVLQVNESCFLHAGTGAWYTIGRGRNTSFNFTQLLKTVTGGTTTLSLTEASNVVQTYSGTATSPNVIVIPSVVQVYYISNQVLGGFNFTIQSPTPGSTLVLPYGQNAVVFCDGVNVINASTSVAGITALLLSAGSVSTPSLAISASNNGLYAPTSSTVAVTAGGVASVTFSGNGVNGRLGGDTPAAVAATTLSASGAVSGAGVTALMASPGPIGSTTPSTGSFTTLSATGDITATSLGTQLTLTRIAVGSVTQRVGGSNELITAVAGSDKVSVTTTGLAVTGALTNTGTVNFGSGALQTDAAGNAGLGVVPSAWGTSAPWRAIDICGANVHSNGALHAGIGCNWYNNGTNSVYKTTGYAQLYEQDYLGRHAWYTAPSGTAGTAITFTQAMTLDASGNLLVGATNRGHTSGVNSIDLDKTDAAVYVTHSTGTPSGNYFASFGYVTTSIGSITQSGTTAVAYNTTSDRRLKTNIRPADAARFMDIEFMDYEWIDGRHDCGPIADQLQLVYPSLVTGEKDATEVRTVEITPAVPAVLDAEGVEVTPAVPAVTEQQTFPVYQQVNYQGLIGRIGTRVQSLQRTVDAQAAMIEALSARLTAAGIA
jgi:hypothetical protein